MKEELIYEQKDDRMVIKNTYDNSELLIQNREDRNTGTKSEQYKGNLVKVASISEGDLVRLKNMGYDLMSADPDEKRRALLYIQQNEQDFLTVKGKPFAKNRQRWV